jgi:nicotinamide-nucleotide adenylyltransferase
MMEPTRGILVGRFQPFHEGHRRLVEAILDEVDELVIGIGSADVSHEPHNPFTAGERIMMTQKVLAAYDTLMYPVPLVDIGRNALWVSHVRSMSPRFDVAYSNNPLVERLFDEAGVECRGTEMFDRDNLKGTEVRQLMHDGGQWRQFVPDPTVEVIEEIDGIERIRALG